jgi:hypothetical protein
MEQRPLRLGDIVDDYCPRERRITNHAIVAIVDQSIRQTRCTTCDAEHAYKDAKVPRRKKKDDADALYDEVLADATPGQLVPKTAREHEPSPVQASGDDNDHDQANGSAPQPAVADPPAPAAADEPAADDQSRADDIWPAHRTLIRATLPRVEGGDPPPRPIPEFTMHQRQGRGGHGFRHGGQQGWSGNGHGQGQGRNGFRPGRGGHGQSQGQGHSGDGGRHRHRGGKNRQPK